MDASRCPHSRLRGAAAIGLRVGPVIARYRMVKHFTLTITDTGLAFARKHDAIHAGAAFDGLYVVRASLSAEALSAPATVSAYKGLSAAERAFRSLKTVDLHVRPIFPWNATRVRAHVFLCMLAYYIEWHMREKLKPLLFDDEDRDEMQAGRLPPVTKAQRSESAQAKDTTKRTADGRPVPSFRTLLADLATLTYNVCHTPLNPEAKILIATRPTPLQDQAFRLLGASRACTQ